MSSAIGSWKTKYEDLQAYKRKYFPNLWNEARELICLVTVILSYLLVTYMAVFDYRHEENVPILIIIYSCDVVYIVDILIRFFESRRKAKRDRVQAAYSHAMAKYRESNQPPPLLPDNLGIRVSRAEKWKARTRHLVSKSFWKKYSTFFLDLLSILPLELFVLIFQHQVTKKTFLVAFSCLKLNRLLRLYRISNYYRKKTHEIRVNLTRREIMTMSVCFTSFLVILFHGIACTWYRLSCDGVYEKNEQVQCYELGEQRFNTSNYRLDASGYRPRVSPEEGAWGIYVSQVHWAVTSLRNSGNRYDPPVTAPQLVLAMFIQVFGFLMCTGIMLTTIYVSSQIDLKRAIYFHEAYGASALVKHFKMSGTVIKFLNTCFNFMWKQNRAFTDHNVRPILCRTMKTQIFMNVFEPMIKASELLRCFLPEELEKLSLDVQYRHFFANEFIVRPNTVGHYVFYIVQGSVEVMSEEDPTLAILTLNSGSLIGEVNIVYPTRRSNGVKTRTPSDILMLPFASVMTVGKHDALRLEQMMTIVKNRMNWLAEENEKKFKEELDLVKAEQAKRKASIGPSASDEGESSHSVLDPMEILLHRRNKSMAPPRASDAAHPAAAARRVSSGPTRKPKGAQFMSVLAWLNFYKWERRAKQLTKSQKYVDIYSLMQPNLRNEASVNMYNVISTIPSIPKYVWSSVQISRESSFLGVWEFFVVLIIAAHAFVYPIEILIATSDPKTCGVINVIVDVVFGLDLFLRLLVFLDPNEIVPVLSSRWVHICREFRTFNIWFDIIPVLPIHHLAGIELGRAEYRSYMYARMPLYLFKSIKLFLFIRKWENNVRINVTLVRIFKHLVYVSVYIVWLGSTYTYLGCPQYPNCAHATKMDRHTFHPDTSIPNIIHETWVDKFLQLNNLNSTSPYRVDYFPAAFPLSMFWAICAIFGIQLDIATPSTRDETALQTAGLLCGFALIIYFCSDLAATLSGLIESKINHVDKLVWIKNYMDEQHIALELIDRVTHYLTLQWKALRGLSSEAASVSTSSSGFLSVSHTMNKELMVHIVGECLLNAYFFQNMDTDILRRFSLAAMVSVIPPNEEILKSGDLVARMHIIRRGYVQVYYGDTDIKMDVLTSGQSFGEVNMLYGTPSRVTCRTITYVEIIMLDSRSFERILPLSKINQDELRKLREDKEALAKFNARIDSAIDTFSETEIQERKYRAPSLESSPFKRFRKEVTRVNSRGLPFTTLEPGRSYEKVFHEHKAFKWLRNVLLTLTYLPDGIFIQCWEHFRIFTICAIIFIVPPIEAYPDFKEAGWHYVYILDAFTFIDMYIRAHIAYYDSRTQELITHPLKTARHYLASGFLADLLGSLPVYAIIDVAFAGTSWDATLLAFMLRLNRLVLIYRVFGFYRYKSQGRASMGMPIRKMMMLLPVLLFHIHIVGCLASVIACPSTLKAWDDLRATNPGARCYPNSWVSSSKHKEAVNPSSLQLYVFSFYYIGTTSIGLGFGDFKPSNQQERMFATGLFFCYIFVLTYILAMFAGTRSHTDHKLLRFQQHMKYLVGFITHEKLDTKLASRIIRHYNYQWLRTRGVEPQRLFSNLFPALRKEVAFDVFEDVFGEVPELKGVTESFLRTICVYMVPTYFLRRDVIVRRTDICDTIYFVFRGKVALSKEDNDEETVIERGSIIGVLDPRLRNPVYDRTIVSITNVDLFAIPRKDFIRAMQAFPEVCTRFDARNLAEAEEVEEVSAQLAKIRTRLSAQSRSARSAMAKAEAEVVLEEAPRLQRKRSRHVSISVQVQTQSEHDDSGAGQGQGLGPSNTVAATTTSALVETKPSHRSRRDLQRELHSEDSMSKLKSKYSDYSVSMVLQEDQEHRTKYDEDALYAQSILPESRCVRVLTMLVLISACCSASLVFYQYTFEAYNFGFFIAGYLCDITYIVKMCMGFRVSYFNEQGDVIVDSTEISNKYLREISGFTLDFLSTFPLELFSGVYALAKSQDSDYKSVFYWWATLRLNRLMRLTHVGLFYKRRTSGFLVHLIPVKLERILMSTLMYIHFMACILYSNTGFVKLKSPCDCTVNPICTTDLADVEVWYQTKHVDGSEGHGSHLPCHKYTLSLYFIITTFTTTSYADVFPISVFEMLFTTFLAYSSKVWLCLVLSDIMSGLQNNVDLSYHLAADGVLLLYKEYGVPRPILSKAADYFTYAWVQNRGVLFPDFLTRAPACLKMDICTTIYGDHFRKSYLFRSMPDSFIRQACIRLKQEWIMAGDYVIHQGEIDDKLYFIHHGIIANTRDIKAAEEQAAGPSTGTGAGIDFDTGRRRSRRKRNRRRYRQSLNHGFMSRSKHFGEAQGMLGAQPHICSHRAETNVDVVSLSHADIEDLFHLFPEYHHTVMRRFRGNFTPTNTAKPGHGRRSHGTHKDEGVQTDEGRDDHDHGKGGHGHGGGTAGRKATGTGTKHVQVVKDGEGNKFAVPPQDDSMLGQVLQ